MVVGRVVIADRVFVVAGVVVVMVVGRVIMVNVIVVVVVVVVVVMGECLKPIGGRGIARLTQRWLLGSSASGTRGSASRLSECRAGLDR
eukprot:6262404-Heterocapsa_arctica.AAC.1